MMPLGAQMMRWTPSAVALILCASSLHAQDVRLVAKEARSALNTASLLRALEDDADPQDYVAAARADYRRLLTALYAEGYYAGTISITVDGVEAANIAPLDAPSTITEVVIRVEPGAQFTFGDVNIAPLAPGSTLPETLGSRETANSDVIQSAVSGNLRSWRNLGYATARVTDEQIIAQHATSTLDVGVSIAPGPQLTFGALNIRGNEDVRTDRILEIAGLPNGETYSPDEIDTAENRLRRTGAFSSVSMTEADVIGANNTLDINAQIAESKPRRIGVGIELSTIDGLTLSTYWLHRNWFGGAEQFRVDGEVAGIGGETGGIDYSLGTSFTRPATFGADTDFYITTELSHEDEPDYLLDKLEVELGFSRILTEHLTVSAGVGLLTAYEETDLDTREYTLLTLPLDATYDRRDDSTDAKTGYYIDSELTPFVSLLGDNISGARSFTDVRGYYSFGQEQGLTFAARGQFGNVFGAGIDEAPADFLFYSGGGGTVRGQSYNALGIDTDDSTTGGTSFVGLQLETRVQVWEKISLVGFYDVGAVEEDALPFETDNWHAGAGFGLRYDTGIGPLRLDLGTQASGDDAGEDLQVYIGIGQAF